MIKKILLSFTIIASLSFLSVFAVNEPPCNSSDCINSANFTLKVKDIAPGGDSLIGGGAEETVSLTLDTIITKLIVAFGVLALLIMTIGGGYMILYHGQDDLLSKGKTIFMSGLLALAIALGAGILVQLVAYLLYTGT